MNPNFDDETPELEIEEARAGREAPARSDLFDRLEETTWVAPADDPGGHTVPAESDSEIADPDAERAAEHQRQATGHPVVRFHPEDIHNRHNEEDTDA